MAATSAVSMAAPLVRAGQSPPPCAGPFLKPLPVRHSRAVPMPVAKFEVRASLREKAVAGITAAALTASMVLPDVAAAAGGDVTPSLKNFLLSIVAGGVVLAAIGGAVIGVANFDPVKRS